MRVFVVLASCLAVVSAAPQSGFASGFAGASAGTGGFGGDFAGAVSTAQAAAGARPTVTIERVPPTFEKTFVGNNAITGIIPNPGAIVDAEYEQGYQDGLREAYEVKRGAGVINQAGADATVITNAFANANANAFANANANAFANANVNANANAAANARVKVIYKPSVDTKSFYYHIADEKEIANTATDTLTITPRKHYKVIFIKAPSAEANAAARALAASRVEEKTIVYVLVNKPVAADAGASAIDDSTFKYGKPEVFFIKYDGAKSRSNSGSSSIASADAFAGTGSGPFGGVSQAGANADAFSGFGVVGTGASANAGAISGSVGGIRGFGGANAGAAANAGATSGGFGGFNNVGASANAGASAGSFL